MRPGTDSNRPWRHSVASVALLITCGFPGAGIPGCHSARRHHSRLECGAACSQPSDTASLLDSVGQHQPSSTPRTTTSCKGNCDTKCQQCAVSHPRELRKVSLPDYVIEPPDVLVIDVRTEQRQPDDEIQCGELLHVRMTSTLPADPFNPQTTQAIPQFDETCKVRSDGTLFLNPEYGAVAVRGLTVPEARRMIELHLQQRLPGQQVFLSRSTDQDCLPLSSEHPVRPDGTVSLGEYGPVYVAGLTLSSARHSIERHLAGHLHQPRVHVDVGTFDSKFFYVVIDQGRAGEKVSRFPSTGNETVLDALAQINVLPAAGSKRDIWIARPAPPEADCEQILPVDWDAIVRGGQSRTNYQLLPGDRVYVQADPKMLPECQSDLLGRLFDKSKWKHRRKLKQCHIACDCSFGYFSTVWRPWGICSTTCGPGSCSTTYVPSSTIVSPEIRPGYSTLMPSTGQPGYTESWSHPDNATTLREYSETFPAQGPAPTDGQDPILMTPQENEPIAVPSSLPGTGSPVSPVDPFPRAIQSNPVLPNSDATPYRSTPAPSPVRQPVTTPENEPRGTGIPLPPRRPTSVTIDVPPDSNGSSSLRLPDSTDQGAAPDAISPPELQPPVNQSASPGTFPSAPTSRPPAVTPSEGPEIPETPEPALRPQPPIQQPFVPGESSAAYQSPQSQSPQLPSRNFQPATHWQTVSPSQPFRQTGWQTMPQYSSASSQQPTTYGQRPQRPLTPSERVIFLSPPPPRR